MMKQNDQPLLRILCLHGSQQTKEIFRSRLGRLPRKLKTVAELVFVDGPVVLSLREGDDVATRSWWKYGDSNETESFEKSIQFLTQVWSQQGPFHGVLGFSMGGSMACAIAARKHLFQGLRFVIAAGATYKSFLFRSEDSTIDELHSLHIFGRADKLVPLKVSKLLAEKFNSSLTCFYEHEQGHCFPSRAESLEVVVNFIKQRRSSITELGTGHCAKQNNSKKPPLVAMCLNDEVAQEQADEIEAMESIYPDLKLLSAKRPEKQGDPCGHLLIPLKCDNGSANVKICIEIVFGESYPDVLPQIKLQHSLSTLQFPPGAQRRLLAAIKEEIKSLEGMPCAFSAVSAAETWLSDPENFLLSETEDTKEDVSEDEEVNDAQSQVVWADISEDEEKKMVENATEEACLEIARRKRQMNDRKRKCAYGVDAGQAATGKGVKKFIVGLVGKPSAGKSTFFNCITKLQVEAKVGAHPFTTIEPNLGNGWWASNDIDDMDESKTEFGRDGRGRRLLPLLIKDVAGLIPGAYKGHGKGNRFLNDLCDADILIHIVDCSGSSDKNGVKVTADDESASSAAEDIKWVREELHLWIFGNVSAKWDSVIRAAKASEKAAESRLFELFSGYKSSSSCVKAAAFRANVNVGMPHMWTRFDLHRVVAHFLSVRFPMCLALNKIDILIKSGQLEKIKVAQENALRLGYVSVPCSAATESNLLRLASQGKLEYEFGSSSFSAAGGSSRGKEENCEKMNPKGLGIKEIELASEMIRMFGSTGVLDAISTAVSLREPLLVYPVTGKSDGSGTLNRYFCLQCLPGTTVEHVYTSLRHRMNSDFRVEGDFIRAEVTSIVNFGPMKQCGKDMVLDANSCIVKILTNRKISWQSKPPN